MPELCDVEAFRRYFNRYAAGRRVEEVEVSDTTMLRNSTPQGLGRALKGRRLEKSGRHGKWLVVPARPSTVLLHFGMTGGLDWTSRPDGRHPHDRIVFQLEDGELRYRNMRKLRGWLTSVRGRKEARCPRCRGRVERRKVAGRTAYWCPRCQPDK